MSCSLTFTVMSKGSRTVCFWFPERQESRYRSLTLTAPDPQFVNVVRNSFLFVIGTRGAWTTRRASRTPSLPSSRRIRRPRRTASHTSASSSRTASTPASPSRFSTSWVGHQCCGSGSARIRLILVTWIRIKICKLDSEPDPNLHQFADVKLKCMEFEPILAIFQGLSLFFEAWICIRIRVKSRIRIRIR